MSDTLFFGTRKSAEAACFGGFFGVQQFNWWGTAARLHLTYMMPHWAARGKRRSPTHDTAQGRLGWLKKLTGVALIDQRGLPVNTISPWFVPGRHLPVRNSLNCLIKIGGAVYLVRNAFGWGSHVQWKTMEAMEAMKTHERPCRFQRRAGLGPGGPLHTGEAGAFCSG